MYVEIISHDNDETLVTFRIISSISSMIKNSYRVTAATRHHCYWMANTSSKSFGHFVIKASRVQLKCDGTSCRTAEEVKGKLANGVGSQYPSHYLGTQHYYC